MIDLVSKTQDGFLIISEAFTEEIYANIQEGVTVNIEEVQEVLKERFPKHTYKKIIDALSGIRI